ncbi:hypothetical protein CASFOL_011314 [Castilleja foliolosa]|uniref:Uncharacterized protein n=1 Tax=Castilleja foliolosa TaxID=1961234 RepID=A0ABD3DZ89_9LAMI
MWSYTRDIFLLGFRVVRRISEVKDTSELLPRREIGDRERVDTELRELGAEDEPHYEGDGAEDDDSGNSDGSNSQISPNCNIFKYKTETRRSLPSLSPFGYDDQLPGVTHSPVKAPRKVPRSPYKVLDAPALQDDFYLNLVDWSSHNVLAVGLGNCFYLWHASSSKVVKLCDLGVDDSVCSVGGEGYERVVAEREIGDRERVDTELRELGAEDEPHYEGDGAEDDDEADHQGEDASNAVGAATGK